LTSVAADERGLRCGLVAFVKSRLSDRHAMKIDVIETAVAGMQAACSVYSIQAVTRERQTKLASYRIAAACMMSLWVQALFAFTSFMHG